jgi:hypothetical protein
LKSQIVAQALLDRETKDSYAWVLQCTLEATGIAPKVFVTDADPGMDVAVQIKYPLTFPYIVFGILVKICHYDLNLNLVDHLTSLKKTFMNVTII